MPKLGSDTITRIRAVLVTDPCGHSWSLDTHRRK
jgi:hypothetical protein